MSTCGALSFARKGLSLRILLVTQLASRVYLACLVLSTHCMHHLQVRNIALNVAFIEITRKTQSLDSTGVAAAAHAVTIALWQLGGGAKLPSHACTRVPWT